MKFLKYWNYFIFVFTNWSLPLALFTTYHEIRGEKKYKINSTGFNDLKKLTISSLHKENAFIYQPVNYFIIEKAFRYLQSLKPRGNVVDFGCGKGRIMAVAAHFGFQKIKGIEFAEELCNDAEENLKKIQPDYPDTNFEVFNIDAINYKFEPGDSIFTFFNPFDQGVMLPVVRNMLDSVKSNPREIFILYFNPTEKEIFQSAGFSVLWNYRKMDYLDFSILALNPTDKTEL